MGTAGQSRRFRRATAIVEVTFVLLSVGLSIFGLAPRWYRVSTALRSGSPLRGGWHLDSAMLSGKAQPPLVGVDQRVVAFYVESPAFGNMRSADGALWRTFLKTDEAKHTVEMRSIGGKPPLTKSSCRTKATAIKPDRKRLRCRAIAGFHAYSTSQQLPSA